MKEQNVAILAANDFIAFSKRAGYDKLPRFLLGYDGEKVDQKSKKKRYLDLYQRLVKEAGSSKKEQWIPQFLAMLPKKLAKTLKLIIPN